MKKIFLSFLMLFAVASFGQSADTLVVKGKVNAYVVNLEGVTVIDMRTEHLALTDENGDFVIQAKVGDTLVFSGLQFKRKEIVLGQENFEGKTLNVHLVAVAHQLNEVVIRNYNSITAESLGIIPLNQKKYTPAERKYVTAASYKMNPQGLDPILNLISGRTAMLKKEIEVEKKETYMTMLEKMFDQEHFVKTLQLPLEYVKGFEFYAVDNKQFTKILDTKNKTTIAFLLGELAEKYKGIIACENE
ncbi:Cna B 2 domain containing protein [Flavobacterium daejeonense]|nr:Cna B 2 domain containing protein [Flavobacterium daejeonense]